MRKVTLDDKYALSEGQTLLSGSQALVRLPLLQRAMDQARGLRTAGYISGYRGSPLGGLDQQLWRARKFLDAAGIVFEPGVNEDLAATAIWGTQQAPLMPGAKVQGVFALWYGKGPGLDRSGDPIKHGNRMGSAQYGGVLLAVGDDHTGKSSTVAFQSEQALAANGVPVLYPATVQEYLDFGLLGWALSRFSGAWVGLKCVNDTVETTATVQIAPDRVRIVLPDFEQPAGGLNSRIGFDPLGDDIRLHRYKLPAAQAFARANGLDQVVFASAHRRIGIVAAGKTYLDCRAALQTLGIGPDEARALGITLYKPGLVWPLEPTRLRDFAAGCTELLVVEEKEAFLEPQIAQLLYNMPHRDRPRLIGKRSDTGEPLLPSDVALSAIDIAVVLAARLRATGPCDAFIERKAAVLRERIEQAQGASPIARPPYFCSGCPHNTSTRVPEGSLALSGIGCHTMAMAMDRQTLPPTQMGGEGMTWAGIAPFTTLPHVFQNLGDGTYFHSGLLAIRAAVAARLNITYKILVNDAVAMTGGQPVEGGLSIVEISHQLASERVRRIAVVSDAPARWRALASEFAPGVTIHGRDELNEVQTQLRAAPGVTAILYEQMCAAEKRRRRKRGKLADPLRRVVINAEVCEGCGDCSVKSNCVSIEPLETPLGRKRRIDQSSCNKDYSCIQGFCPSFVLVDGAELRSTAPAPRGVSQIAPLPGPVSSAAEPFCALIAGVGGTGVVTIGAVLAMAAHLEGKYASVFDMTGLAQKGGAVISHLRIGDAGTSLQPPALQASEATLLLACDLVVAAGADTLRVIDRERTQVILNTHVTPVAQFQRDRDFNFRSAELRERLYAQAAPERFAEVDATSAAQQVLGEAIASNLLLVGYAFQCGALPLGAQAIERAIELNGAATAMNLEAFRTGRRLFLEQGAVKSNRTLVGGTGRASGPLPTEQPDEKAVELHELLADRMTRLRQYQNDAYAERYRSLVSHVQSVELASCRSETLAAAVAVNYYRLLAYKDEYEVARLHSSPEFLASLRGQFADTLRLRFLLAPPLLSTSKLSSEPRKIELGGWMLPVFRVLAAGKRVRGTWLDPFGYTHERRMERQLIVDYEETVRSLCEHLSPDNHAEALDIASLPAGIRGFGPVKERSVVAVRAQWGSKLDGFLASAARPAR